MLEREGEVARATSVVRYRPGSRFPRHEHALGEEFLVLEGTFADELGEYPTGTYVRNRRDRGTHRGARTAACSSSSSASSIPRTWSASLSTPARRSGSHTRGIAVLPLHGFGSERVSLVRWAPHTRFVPHPHPHPGGEEIFVLDGAACCMLHVENRAPARRGDVTSARRATVWRKSPKNLAIRRRGSSMAAITLPPEIAREAVDWFASGAGCFFCDRPAESPPRSPARAVWIRLVRILAKGEGALG